MQETWVVERVCLPLVHRRCHDCAAKTFRTSGKFRINANHKLLDVWLLALCTACGSTTKLTVLERANVRSIRHETLDRLHGNDPGLAAEVLQDPVLQRRNRISLGWADAWRLDTGATSRAGRTAATVAVRFTARIPVRPVRLIAEGYGLTRAGVERLVADRRIVSAVRLDGKVSSDFAFTRER